MTFQERIGSILARIVRGGLFVIPLLPLIAFPQLPSLNTGRHFFFRLLIEILFILWLFLCACDTTYRPRWTRFTKTLLLFLGVVTVADVFGVNPYRSFWSTLVRMDGLITLLHVGVMALLLRNVLRKQEEWRSFFALSTVVAVIIASVSLSQRAGFFPWDLAGPSKTATIGNTTFFSGYLLFHIFFSFIVAFHVKRLWQRWVWRAIPVLFIVAIFIASTRGVMVALVFVGAIVGTYFLLQKRNAPYRTTRIVLVGAGIFLIFFIPILLTALRGTSIGRSIRPIAHSVETGSLLGSRQFLWPMAWKGFLERPLLGWGEENYLAVYHRYYDPHITEFGEYWSDHPHNIVLEWLVNAGILGFLAYIALFFAAYRSLVFARRSRTVPPWEIAFLGFALFAYFIQNLFVFDTLLTLIFFFVLLAYSDMLAYPAHPLPVRTRSSLSVVGYHASAVFCLLLFVLTFNLFFIHPLRAAYNFNRVRTYTIPYRLPIAFTQDFLERALRFETFASTYIREETLVQITGTLARQYGDKNLAFLQFVSFVTSEGEKEALRFPSPDPRIFYFLGEVYRARGATDPVFLVKAKTALTNAIRLSPMNQRFWLALARVYLLERKPEAAIAIMDGVSSQVPLIVSELEPLVDAYIAAHQYTALANFSRQLIARDPLQPNHYRRLWFAYMMQGKKEQAEALAANIRRLHPDWPASVFLLQ